MTFRSLDIAPTRLTIPTYARYEGESTWGFKPSLTQRLRQKKWQWFGVFDAELAIGGAIVDVGYASKVFVWAYHLGQARWWLDTTKTLLPQAVSVSDSPRSGQVASGGGLQIRRENTEWRVVGEIDGVGLDLVMSEGPPPGTAVCPTPVGWNVTRKQACLTVDGAVSGTHVHTFSDASGLLDHSNGIMARQTSWLWAMGGGRVDGKSVGINAISGFNADLENFVWLDNEVLGFGHAMFKHDDSSWRVVDDEGLIALEMRPAATRVESLDLKLVKSVYEQPLGLWQGEILGKSVEFFGVAEDHRATW